MFRFYLKHAKKKSKERFIKINIIEFYMVLYIIPDHWYTKLKSLFSEC